nr:MAG TPA: hypothetical protein [Bacteriophage sp.]
MTKSKTKYHVTKTLICLKRNLLMLLIGSNRLNSMSLK